MVSIETEPRIYPEVQAAMPQRKRVLYVERDSDCKESPYSARKMAERFSYIRDSLSQRFDTETHRNLSSSVPLKIKMALERETTYDALVTHVPFDDDILNRDDVPKEPYEFLKVFYGGSLDTIREIKQIDSGLFIVAYTGACVGNEEGDKNIMRLFKEEGPIDEVVAKSGHVEEDYALIETYLMNHFGML